MEQFVQIGYELLNLPRTVCEQYPVAVAVIITIASVSWITSSWTAKKRQKLVDDVFTELTDREKTSPALFLHQLRMLGIIDQQERLVLAGKYGPGIASEVSLAKVAARLMLDHLFQSERLARDVVNHFMTELSLKFEKRHGHLKAFWAQTGEQFSNEIDEEITDLSLLDGAIGRQLAQHLRVEKVRLAYLASQKERKSENRRQSAIKLAYGIQKTWWELWSGLALEMARSITKRTKTKVAPAKANSLSRF